MRERYQVFKEALKKAHEQKREILKKTFIIKKLPIIGVSPKNSFTASFADASSK